MSDLRTRIFFLLESHRPGDRASWLTDLFLVGLILINVLAAILETVPSLRAAHASLFVAIETVSLVIFSIEYLLRLVSCTAASQFADPLRGRIAFALTPLMLIDLGVLLCTFFADLRTLRVLRLMRLGRYSERLRLLGRVVRDKAEDLAITFVVAISLLVLCATAMFWLEHEHNPAFSSIPHTMWWGVATLTTVGYGDVYPLTPLGKIFGAIVALIGVGMFALPAGILAGGFNEALVERRKKTGKTLGSRCPHCGKRP